LIPKHNVHVRNLNSGISAYICKNTFVLLSVRRQFTTHNSSRTINRTQFTAHNSPPAQFTVHNSPRQNSSHTIHRAQLTTHNSPRHNSPCTIHRTQFTAHNSPCTAHNSPSIIHRVLFTTKYKKSARRILDSARLMLNDC
jgi:desulfoferrodoxin (superoxide reductase-like protein)